MKFLLTISIAYANTLFYFKVLHTSIFVYSYIAFYYIWLIQVISRKYLMHEVIKIMLFTLTTFKSAMDKSF